MAPAAFSHLSSPETDDAAVDAIVSQATDLAVLEQITSLNSSHLFSDSGLPNDLETRFQKLKSFPAAAHPKPATTSRNLNSDDETRPTSLDRRGRGLTSSINSEQMRKIKHGTAGAEVGVSSPTTNKKEGAKELEAKLRSGFGSDPPIPSRDSPSPPRQVCCFWRTPRRVSRKKGVTIFGLDPRDLGKNDEVLSDLSTFSPKEQSRRMKKALEEEEKVIREAEEVVKWVKHASARFDVSTIDELVRNDQKIS